MIFDIDTDEEITLIPSGGDSTQFGDVFLHPVTFEFETDDVELEVGESGEIDFDTDSYIPMSNIRRYTGAYEYTPSDETQTIQIRGKEATQNIIINPIPSNYGEVIWNGATLTVR